MNKRQLKKLINKGRFTSVIADGLRYFDAVVRGNTVTLFVNGEKAATADVCEVAAAHIG